MYAEDRIYLSDSYCREFSASVTGVEKVSGSESLVFLDRTSFYPESGGQPYDTGTISGKDVIEVRERNRSIAHLVEGSFEVGEKVDGIIDFDRRFDHMQQHTGQHILSRVFLDLYGLKTAGFHMGDSSSTIDLEGVAPSAADLERVEAESNRLVYANLPVIISSVSREEFEETCERPDLQTRSNPPGEAGIVRLVEVKGLDINPCCGTHTERTGEIGIISITGTEKVRNSTRVEFLCGGRALSDYREKRGIVDEAASIFSTSHRSLVKMVEKVAEENRSLKKELKSAKADIASSKAGQLEPGTDAGGHSLIKRVIEGIDPKLLGKVAAEMREEGKEIILLGAGGETPALVFACSPELELDMAGILREASAVMNARGGGTRDFARGGGGDPGLLKDTLDRGEELVREILE